MWILAWFDKKLSENQINQFIFSVWLVTTNAVFPWILSSGGNTSIFGRILGVLFWIILMFYSVKKYCSISDLTFRKSLLYGYLIKTIFAVFCIIYFTVDPRILWNYFISLDVISWTLSIIVVNFILDPWSILWTFLTTIIDGFILNFFTLVFSCFLFLFLNLHNRIVWNRSNIKKSSS